MQEQFVTLYKQIPEPVKLVGIFILMRCISYLVKNVFLPKKPKGAVRKGAVKVRDGAMRASVRYGHAVACAHRRGM